MSVFNKPLADIPGNPRCVPVLCSRENGGLFRRPRPEVEITFALDGAVIVSERYITLDQSRPVDMLLKSGALLIR